MEYILAFLAAAFSFAVNRLFVEKWAALTIVGTSPALEESAKTLPAYYLSLDILMVHLLFGLIEGALDFWRSGKSGLAAGLLSVAGHSAFGVLTVLFLSFTKSIVLALLGAVIVHIAWNAAVNRIVNS
jgi:hypothetical protein